MLNHFCAVKLLLFRHIILINRQEIAHYIAKSLTNVITTTVRLHHYTDSDAKVSAFAPVR